LGRAGEDPSAGLSVRRSVSLPRAALFDGATRTFLRDEAGLLQDVHPIDQAVALALLTELKKLAAAPTAGSGVRAIPFAGGPTLFDDVTTYCRKAVERFTAGGDIREVGINVTVPFGGRVNVTYDYERIRDVGSSGSARRIVTVT